jgi:hypothetical protein
MLSEENRKKFPSPVSAPGGRGPALSTTANPLSTKPWFDILGLMLGIHDGHGYSTFDRFMPTFRVLTTRDVLRGLTSSGLYFDVDWCPSCTTFTPILNKYYEARWVAVVSNTEGTPFQVILILQCKTNGTPTISLGTCLGWHYFISILWVHKDNH